MSSGARIEAIPLIEDKTKPKNHGSTKKLISLSNLGDTRQNKATRKLISLTSFGDNEDKMKRFDHVGCRLAFRKTLFRKRKYVCDFSLAFAVIGIALMILETELYLEDYHKKFETGSVIIRSLITMSTIILLAAVFSYHVLDIQIYMLNNSLDNWRLALSVSRVLKITVELVIYAIHPLPINYNITWNSLTIRYQEIPNVKQVSLIPVPIDVLLSLPMFLRLFLVSRVILLHSKLYTDASSQSIGALNRIRFNFSFIFKSMMNLYPEYVLAVVMLSGFFIASWSYRVCELFHQDKEHSYFLNSMWIIAVTFLSVGYGDIVPLSYCGRFIAVITGMFGAGCTALVVAVLARKLELSSSEKYVHNFVIDMALSKRRKMAAANIVKYGWIYYHKKKQGKVQNLDKVQRKLLKAIHQVKEIKNEQRLLIDHSATLIEIAKTQNNMYDLMSKQKQSSVIDKQIKQTDKRLQRIEEKLDKLCHVMGRP